MTIELLDVRVTHQGRALVNVPQLLLEPGRAVTLVGESGSGKSLLAHALMGSLPRSLQVDGLVSFGGERTPLQDAAARRKLWGHRLALLPQEPALALDPTMRVDQQIAEGHPGFLRGRRGRLAALEEAWGPPTCCGATCGRSWRRSSSPWLLWAWPPRCLPCPPSATSG